MPHSIEKYKILVASPSDVRDERESMEEVINELNRTYGERNNLVIELIKWETHSAPAASETDVQDKIDKDLGSDYDLFIGILWKTFGSPTIKYKSGTEQEFRNAYIKFKEKSNSSQILFYFKTSAPTSLTDIDPSQLELINKFKSEMGEKGIYYWTYNTNEELQKFLRIHIPKRLDELRKHNTKHGSTIELTKEIEQGSITLEKDELGILDYQDIVEESFSDSNQALLRITESIEWVGKEIRKKTDEMIYLSSNKKEISKKTKRDIFTRTAEIMNDFATRLVPDIPIFINGFEKGADAFLNLITLSRTDFGDKQKDSTQEALTSLRGLISGIEGGIRGMEYLLNSVSSLPRMEKNLNRARRNVEIKLKEFIEKLEVSYSIAKELDKNLNDN